MRRQSVKCSPIKVICESCVQALNPECLLCKGQRFYLWDPVTLFCYDGEGEPLIARNSLGEQVPVTRQSSSTPSEVKLDMRIMLEFIELWAAEKPVRKWKLVLDQSGWQACVWFNVYKKVCFETSETSLDACITRTYREILKRSKKR